MRRMTRGILGDDADALDQIIVIHDANGRQSQDLTSVEIKSIVMQSTS